MADDDPKALQVLLERAAPPDMALSFRPMFGGIMGYAEGRVFASLSDVGLGLKLAGAAQAALLAVTGAVMLRYAPDQPLSKSYVLVPPALRDDALALRPWIVRCVAELKAAKLLKSAQPGKPKGAK